MSPLARDIASASRGADGAQESWAVDPLTRKVFVHSVTTLLDPDEAQRLRDACAERQEVPIAPDVSDAGRAVLPLLTAIAVPDPREKPDRGRQRRLRRKANPKTNEARTVDSEEIPTPTRWPMPALVSGTPSGSRRKAVTWSTPRRSSPT